MAFFEDFGKKITQTGQEAVQKTKDFTETTRLSGEKSEIQRKIESYYTQIGKLYFELHSTNPDDSFQQLVFEIQKGFAQIRQIDEQINHIKGIKPCPSCGAAIAQGSTFCSSCGAKLSEIAQQKESSTKKCPNCGTAIAEDSMFCGVCGTQIDHQTVEEEGSQEISDENTAFLCPDCGSVVPNDALFCVNCGRKLQ